jgi:hypothetical protein
MPRQKVTTVYDFAELSDKAKARARDWYRDMQNQDHDYADCVIDAAKDAAGLLGITFDTHPVRLLGGGTRHDPKVWWTLHVQGAGACFEGRHSYTPDLGMGEKIRAEFPQDTALHEIADGLAEVQVRYGGHLDAIVTSSGHSTHAYGTTIEVYHSEEEQVAPADVELMRQYLRAFMNWIYKALSDEWDSRQTDEYIDEQITANEYDFDTNGRRA